MRIEEKYSFEWDELSEETQEKVIEKLYDINVDYTWWDCTYEDAENIGLKITGFDLDRYRHCTGSFLLSAAEVSANIFKNHGKDYETYKTAKSFMEKWEPIYSDYLDETSENYESFDTENTLMELENDYLQSLLEDYSIMLQHDYDYLTSKEAIIKTIQANEYTFYTDGNIA